MKKRISLLLMLVLSLGIFTACGDKAGDGKKVENEDGSVIVKIGVSPDPHAKIIEFVKDDLKEEGIDIEIVEFTDYIIPNRALDSGEVDLNFFQHLPYLESFIEEEDLDLVSMGGVHVEPIALYSETLSDIDDLEDGAEIAIPNDAVNGGRALLLLEANGLIKLDEDAGLEATENDIVKNPKNLVLKPLEAATLPRVLSDVDGAIINGNYAIGADLNPLEDGILIEDKESPYVNIIAARKEDEKDETLLKVIEKLNTEKVKDYLIEEYKGAVVPAF